MPASTRLDGLETMPTQRKKLTLGLCVSQYEVRSILFDGKCSYPECKFVRKSLSKNFPEFFKIRIRLDKNKKIKNKNIRIRKSLLEKCKSFLSIKNPVLNAKVRRISIFNFSALAALFSHYYMTQFTVGRKVHFSL